MQIVQLHEAISPRNSSCNDAYIIRIRFCKCVIIKKGHHINEIVVNVNAILLKIKMLGHGVGGSVSTLISKLITTFELTPVIMI